MVGCYNVNVKWFIKKIDDIWCVAEARGDWLSIYNNHGLDDDIDDSEEDLS